MSPEYGDFATVLAGYEFDFNAIPIRLSPNECFGAVAESAGVDCVKGHFFFLLSCFRYLFLLLI